MITRVATIALLGLIAFPSGPPQQAAGAEATAEFQGDDPKALASRFDEAFNRGEALAVAALFADEAEFVDEEGNLYRGREAIAEALKSLFELFPGLTLERDVEEVRMVGSSLAIEEGQTTMTSKDQGKAQNRYLAVLIKGDEGWQIASMRQVADEPSPTPHDFLEPIAWLVGDWVSEEADQHITVSFHWSDDGNFLLGGYTIEGRAEDGGVLRTDQRIGWDAAHEVIRSWNFDSDGGFSEGRWSTDGSAWVVKSDLVLPEGLTGSATFYLNQVDENRFVWSSLDRVIGGIVQPDVEVTIVRKPPAPKD